jgi:DGQHR domain-containing protein
MEKTLHQFAAVSQLRRDENRVIHGYQRPEVLKHIGEIRRYLESTAPMIPNAIVIAFDERVKFKPHNQVNDCSYSQHGELVIPLDSADGGEKLPGWIVDGQQRAAAIRDAEIGSFPVCVTAFVTNDLQEQREQFILVNTTKPLPKGLIYELLPSTRSRLPTSFQRRRFPAKLMNRLNNESHSPFHRLIQTPTTPTGIVKDNSILRMLTNSLTDGALHPYRDPAGEGDEEMMVSIIYAFWSSVKTDFSASLGRKTRRSRLMHGVGIVAMGYLMDAIADRYRSNTLSTELFQQDIEILSDAQIFFMDQWILAFRA